MGFVDQCLGNVFFQTWQANFQLNFNAEAGRNGANTHTAINLSVVGQFIFSWLATCLMRPESKQSSLPQIAVRG